MSGGGANLPPNPSPAYTFQNMPSADANAMGGIGQINTNLNNGYTSGLSNLGATELSRFGRQMLPWATDIMKTGFDPQQQLFQQLFQQQQDQGNVAASQAGLSSSPYAAGIAQQSNQNFDINWQNQQLGRQSQAAGAAGGLLSAGGNAIQQGTGIGQSIAGFNNQGLQQQIADYLAYLQGGTSATNAATSQYGAESQAQLQNQQLENQSMGGIGSLLGNLLGLGQSGGGTVGGNLLKGLGI